MFARKPQVSNGSLENEIADLEKRRDKLQKNTAHAFQLAETANVRRQTKDSRYGF